MFVEHPSLAAIDVRGWLAAACLQGIAEPNRVVIAESVESGFDALHGPRVLTKAENAVQVEPTSPFELRGIRQPLAAYNALDAL
jgi:class 3 adenylate cyclase